MAPHHNTLHCALHDRGHDENSADFSTSSLVALSNLDSLLHATVSDAGGLGIRVRLLTGGSGVLRRGTLTFIYCAGCDVDPQAAGLLLRL